MESFDQALGRFLAAVQHRRREDFIPFLAADAKFRAVLPGGQVFTDVDTYRQSQEAWFSATSGSFEPKVEVGESSGDLGTAMVRVNYSNATDTGIQFRAELMITFTFRHQDGRWLLKQSQNTVLGEVEI